jgi:diguanylate cyclase (GGDEF)-like protein
LENRAYWLIPLLAGPLLLLHRHFATYLDRVKEAVTDPLTKLPNQRFLMEHLARALQSARESERPLAMVFFDVNNFKALNDQGGHAVGDKALRLVADSLRGAIRSRDVCARYAGDEFVAVFADCGRAEAALRADDLQATIRKLAVHAPSGSRMPLSVSAGIAVYPEDGDTIERLFVVADRRMYE